MSDRDDDTPQYMRLGDGTLIDTKSGKRVVDTAINRAFSDKPETSLIKPARKGPAFDGAKRRFLDDLPVTPNQSRAVALVSSFMVFGLSVTDIAFILNTDENTVEAVIQSEAYTKFLDAMLQNIREHDQDKIRKKLNAAAEDAANRITALAKESKDEKVALAASRDVLDRVTSGAADRNNSGGASPSSLTIRIIDDRDNPTDKIEVDFNG